LNLLRPNFNILFTKVPHVSFTKFSGRCRWYLKNHDFCTKKSKLVHIIWNCVVWSPFKLKNRICTSMKNLPIASFWDHMKTSGSIIIQQHWLKYISHKSTDQSKNRTTKNSKFRFKHSKCTGIYRPSYVFYTFLSFWWKILKTRSPSKPRQISQEIS
jgi:hypothetical protein